MILIQDILMSERVFEEKFHCDLQKCKGACCWEGDYGAPLLSEEIDLIKTLMDKLEAVLPADQWKVLQKKGPSEYYTEAETVGTALMPDTSCVYLIREEGGHAKCAFEILYEKGIIDFKKPISCELYPLRLIELEETGFIGINFDDWDICNDACVLGKKMNLPVFRFVKNAIIRKFGKDFYEDMEAFYRNQMI